MTYKKMNPKYKKKWVEALESGKYRQTRKRLCETINKKRHYCCLGVLCEVGDVPRGRKFHGGTDTYDGNLGSLSTKLKEKFGISSVVHSKLIALNDDELFSFKEIADWIRKNL